MKRKSRRPAKQAIPPKIDGRRERGRVRRLAMVDAARELFISCGYKGTTLEAIIARSGGSREAIYSAFGGKPGLVGAIIAQANERLSDAIVASTRSDLPPREALKRVALQLVEIWQSAEGRAINNAILTQGLDAPELVNAWFLSGTQRSIEALGGYLEDQVVKGRFVELDAELVARQFLTLLIGEMAFPFIARLTRVPGREAQVMRCVDLILRAYATEP